MIDLIDNSETGSVTKLVAYASVSDIPAELPTKEVVEVPCSDDDAILVEECSGESSKIVNENETYFTIENLFSEIKTKYLQIVARRNLGLSDDLSLTWGNITGNLENQKDLSSFVKDLVDNKIGSIQNTLSNLISNLNLLLDNTVYYGSNTTNLHAASNNTILTDSYSGNIYILSKDKNIEFEVNGLVGGFIEDGTKVIESETFYIFKSVYSNLGITKIIIRNGNI